MSLFHYFIRVRISWRKGKLWVYIIAICIFAFFLSFLELLCRFLKKMSNLNKWLCGSCRGGIFFHIKILVVNSEVDFSFSRFFNALCSLFPCSYFTFSFELSSCVCQYKVESCERRWMRVSILSKNLYKAEQKVYVS